MRGAVRPLLGALLTAFGLCVVPAVGVADPSGAPNSPFLGENGEVRVLIRPEFRDAPGLLEDLKRFGIEGLGVELTGPLVENPKPRGPKLPSRLVLAGQPEIVARGREVLGYLDVPRPAVVVSLLVAEVACARQGETGGHVSIDRVTPPGTKSTVFRGLFSEFEPNAYLRSSLTTQRPYAGTSVAFGNTGQNVLEDGAFEVVLRALALEGSAEFLAWPTVICTEGLPGSITSLVQTTQDVMKSSSSSSLSVITRPTETGVQFEVIPVKVASDAAVLDLTGVLSYALPEPTDGEAAGEVVIQKRRVKTRVTIRDQESLLIGGLKVRRRVGDQRGLPILRGIPGLTATSKDCLETELILLIRARVIVPGRGGGVLLPPGESRRLGAARRAADAAPNAGPGK